MNKTIGSLLACSLIAGSLAGQGVVDFNTQLLGPDARVGIVEGTVTNFLSGSEWFAQLWTAPGTNMATAQLSPAGTPVNFRSGVNAGYVQTGGSNAFTSHVDPIVVVTPEVALLPSLDGGGPALVQLRVWPAPYSSWTAAQAAGALVGQSRVLQLAMTGFPPRPPVLLEDAQGGLGFVITDPKPRMARIQMNGPDVQIEFITTAGRIYRLETSSTLTEPIPWEPLPGASTLAGIDGAVTFTHTNAAGTNQRFYRAALNE